MINVEDLLKPIADDKPCGEDFTYHPSFQNLETLARGKPETQFSSAVEPEWKEVKDAAIEVLSQSKHLGAALILSNALVQLGGLDGLTDGLAVVRGITEKYWLEFYPKLDPDDNNDPTERLSILNSLSSPKFVLQLGDIVLCDSPAMGRVTFHQLIRAREKADKTSGSDSSASAGPEMSLIQAAFRDAGVEAAKGTLTLVDGAIGHVGGIERFIDATLGAGRGVNLDLLTKSLNEVKRGIEPFANDGSQPAGAETGSSDANPEAGRASRGGRGMLGAIQSRADVLKALQLICDFYQENEPSSPVPLILQRASRLVDKDFMTILTDLTPDALAQLRVITGTKSDQ